jgi:2-dehydro-3-deoxygluconokinase
MFLAFGEIMMRVATPGHLRFRQALPGSVDVTFAGAEANVCASLAMFGAKARFVTALPRNAITESLTAVLRGLGVDTDQILWRDSGRLGVYFLETGANQRGSIVIYDRDHSAVSQAGPEEYDFDKLLAGIEWVHVTGITPSLGENAFRSTMALVQQAKSKGLRTSCDLNFRAKLWRWRKGVKPKELAQECMSQLLPSIDLVIANEEDAADVLGIHAKGTSVDEGKLDAAAYEQVAREIIKRFSNIAQVAITLRQSVSADHNNWGALLFDVASGKAHFAPVDEAGDYRPYEIRDIVDRVGGGDSFGAGLMYALNSAEYRNPASAIRFAVAASCLKHSVLGDFNYVTRDEVVALMQGKASGRVRR